MKTVILFIALFYNLNSYAFNWNKCKRGMIDTSGSGYGTVIVSGITNMAMLSTQYVSSWGGCSALAKTDVERDREEYYAVNKDEIFVELAKGERGEYVTTLLDLFNCEPLTQNYLTQQMRGRSKSIFKGNSKESYMYVKDFLKTQCSV